MYQLEHEKHLEQECHSTWLQSLKERNLKRKAIAVKRRTSYPRDQRERSSERKREHLQITV